MSTTARDVINAALMLTGHVNQTGSIDFNREMRYFGVAPSYLTILVNEIANAENLGVPAQTVNTVDDLLIISDQSARKVLPVGLAMYFSALDGDNDLYNHYSQLYYGNLLPSVNPGETTLCDSYGATRDPDLMRP